MMPPQPAFTTFSNVFITLSEFVSFASQLANTLPFAAFSCSSIRNCGDVILTIPPSKIASID